MADELLTPWMTVAHAARYALVSESTIEKWMEQGLVFSRLDRIVRLHRDDLDALAITVDFYGKEADAARQRAASYMDRVTGKVREGA